MDMVEGAGRNFSVFSKIWTWLNVRDELQYDFKEENMCQRILCGQGGQISQGLVSELDISCARHFICSVPMDKRKRIY